MDAHPYLEKHGSFKGVKLGRAPVRHDPRTLQFAKYVDVSVVLPAIPKTHAAPAATWPMYGNDLLGDCTIAAAAHLIQAWTKLAGHPTTPPDSSVRAAYWLTGRPPRPVGRAGGATDDGRNEMDVLGFWRSRGIAGDRIGAYVAVDPKNHALVKAAIYLFGGVYTGVALPRSAQGQKRWEVEDGPDAEPGSWGGHAVPYVGYTASAFTCVTWGAPLVLTAGFHDLYCDELYAIVSTDLLDESGKSPAGLNLAQLQADLAAVTA